MKTKLLQALLIAAGLFSISARADQNPLFKYKTITGHPVAVAAATTTNIALGKSQTVALRPNQPTLIKASWTGTAASSTNAVTLTFIGVIDSDSADSTGITAVTMANNGSGTGTVYFQTNINLGSLPFLRFDQIQTGTATGITNLTVTVVTPN